MEYVAYLLIPVVIYLLFMMLNSAESSQAEQDAARVHEETIAMSKYSLALIYEKQAQYDKALGLLNDAEAIFEKHEAESDKVEPHTKQIRETRKRIVGQA